MAARRVRCYVCREHVPIEETALLRHRVPSGVVNTPKPFTHRYVRKCNPHCGAWAR